MKTTTQKKSKVKPISYDIHFEYNCPNDCGSRHWLSLKECQEKNFKIVCDCGTVFKPKRIKEINIQYCKKAKKQIDITPQPESEGQQTDDLPMPDNDFDLDIFIEECIVTLCGFGFEKTEAKELLINSYHKNPTKNSTQLVKQTLLDSFGGLKS